MDVIANILNISSYRCLLLSDVVIGILEEGMDLGKSYLWRYQTVRLVTLREFLKTRLKTKKYIALKSNRIISSAINGNRMKNCF